MRTATRPSSWSRRAGALAVLLGAVAVSAGGAAPTGPHGAQQPAFIVVVHANNPVVQLRHAELSALFLRRQTTFPGGLAAVPVDLPPESSARVAFSRAVLGLSPRAVATYWLQEVFARRASPPPVRSTAAAARAFVASTPGGIAYLPPDTPLDGVRAIRVAP